MTDTTLTTPAAATSAATSAVPPAAPPTAASASPRSASSQRGTTSRLTGLRKIIARRMVASLHNSAQLTTVVEVDFSALVALRARLREEVGERTGVKLTYLPLIARAVLDALPAHPSVNASMDDEGLAVTYHDAEHLGVAVDTPKGLLVPVVHDAGALDVAGLAATIADLAERARGGRLTPEDVQGGTFTITNTGSRGALFDTPIVNLPQSAILGTGAIVERPVAVRHGDAPAVVEVHPMAYLALSYDHRIVDGADAARFLVDVKARLEAADHILPPRR